MTDGRQEDHVRMVRRHLRFFGTVQGVGFRWHALHAAGLYGVSGWVRNEWDGSVSIEAQGTERQIEQLILAVECGSFVHVEHMSSELIPPVDGEHSFQVV